jgi:H+/Cl- antiporter ClcA
MKDFLIQRLRWIFYSAMSGWMAGAAAAFFLITLQWATLARENEPYLVWGLPLVGLFIGWVYFRFGKDVAGGNNLILDEIHSPSKVVPIRMAPLIWLGTVLTHLFGGSAGREGTAVQMGSSLSVQISRYFKVDADERRILLMCGAGAGFGAAIGAPWAGMVFGMEVVAGPRFKLFALLECFIASWVAYITTLYMNAPHSVYPRGPFPEFDPKTLLFVSVAAVVFGLATRVFILAAHAVERFHEKWVSYPPMKPFVGGLVLVILYHWEGTYQYVGLGIDMIQRALVTQSSFFEPIYKGIFTAITVGSGFKGGEFIPLVFIGTTLGSALALVLPVGVPLLSAVGFSSVFGAAAKTPIACMVMAVEIFGVEIAPYAIAAGTISYFASGNEGIYKSQRRFRLKKITT